MNALRSTRFCLLSVALACGAAAHAAPMNASEYGAARQRVEADYKAARAACDKLNGNAKDICVAEAKGQEKVAKAELEHRRSGKAEDLTKLAVAKADAAYEVAKERCDDRSGNEKDVCMKEAKAVETRAKADAKAAGKSTEARKDATEDKRDAEYKVAREKCDSLSGDAKSQCLDAAKARYGKS